MMSQLMTQTWHTDMYRHQRLLDNLSTNSCQAHIVQGMPYAHRDLQFERLQIVLAYLVQDARAG